MASLCFVPGIEYIYSHELERKVLENDAHKLSAAERGRAVAKDKHIVAVSRSGVINTIDLDTSAPGRAYGNHTCDADGVQLETLVNEQVQIKTSGVNVVVTHGKSYGVGDPESEEGSVSGQSSSYDELERQDRYYVVNFIDRDTGDVHTIRHGLALDAQVVRQSGSELKCLCIPALNMTSLALNTKHDTGETKRELVNNIYLASMPKQDDHAELHAEGGFAGHRAARTVGVFDASHVHNQLGKRLWQAGVAPGPGPTPHRKSIMDARLVPKRRIDIDHADVITCIAVTPDGKYVVTASWDGDAKRAPLFRSDSFDMATGANKYANDIGQETQTLVGRNRAGTQTHATGCGSLCITQDSTHCLVSARHDGGVNCFVMERQYIIDFRAKLHALEDQVQQEPSPALSKALAETRDAAFQPHHTLTLYPASKDGNYTTVESPRAMVTASQPSSAPFAFVSWSDLTVSQYVIKLPATDSETPEKVSPIACYTGHRRAINVLALAGDDQWLFTGGHDEIVKVWKVARDDALAVDAAPKIVGSNFSLKTKVRGVGVM